MFAAIVAFAYAAVATFATIEHEMWRDELHCWLVARDSATPWQVVHERAYDGQPPLWYWLLWVLSRFTWRPEAMRVVHVVIATGAVFVFARHAPFPRWVRAIFPFGYFVAYEYAALSRCYGLALLLALLVCVGHRRRTDRPATTGALLFALALTTTVATLVTAAYTLAIALDAWATRRARRAPAPSIIVPVALAAAGGIAAALCAWPPADSTVAQMGVAPQMPWEFAPTRVVAAFLAVPPPTFFFWNANVVLGAIGSPAARFGLAVVLFGVALFVVSGDRVAAVLFAVGTALLVALFKGVYSGSVRHHGFIFVAFVMAAWIAQSSASARAASGPTAGARQGSATRGDDDRAGGGWRTVRDRALVPVLAAVLLVQVPGAAIAIGYDTKYIFSSGKRAADELRARGLEHALIVAEFDFPATAMLGQLGPDAVAYSPRTGRAFTFVKWTPDRRWEPTDEQTLAFTESFGSARGRDPVLVMNRPLLPALVDGVRVERLAEKYDSMIEEENFYIYRVFRPGVAR